jgi:hypothetical protein
MMILKTCSRLALLFLFAIYLTSCSGDDDNSGGVNEAQVRMGIVGFNENITYSNQFYDITNLDQQFAADDFISSLETGPGTGLYFAMRESINKLKENEGNLPDNLSSVFLVTFTDGLDNISGALAGGSSTIDQVRQEVVSLISSSRIKGLPINSYTVGVRGSDISSPDDLQELREDLQGLSSGDGFFFFAENINQLSSEFREIANSLVTVEGLERILKVTMPAEDNGTVVRWTLDVQNSSNAAENSFYYIEGTISKEGDQFFLQNIVTSGVRIDLANARIQGTLVGAATVEFDFGNLGICSNDIPNSNFSNNITTENIFYWRQRDDGTYQIDSESGSGSVENVLLAQKSIAVMLVLDASSSLENDFGGVQQTAKRFLDDIVNGFNNPDTSEIPPLVCDNRDFPDVDID